ncbi:hypothetical protein BDN67DRAFT_980858 [Paxillus ammoniavirescens]|nr:hypothetical protein BDN67DRAFT_980858 [Paxillus ammoniavirescens]
MEREREEMEREREEMEREKREQAREMEREREEMEREKRKQAREIEREREEMEREKRRREKEREREEMERERRQREKEKAREKGRIPKDRVSSVTGFKRKNATQDHEDSPDDSSAKTSIPKRRKLDDGASVASSSSSKFRDAGLLKKPVHEPSSVPRLKIKKESTPMPPPRAPSTTQERPSNSPRPKTNGTTKARRRSPIYTSSEDEGEIPQPRKHDPSPPPISDRSNSGQSSGKESRLHSRTLYPLPTDHAALRALYHSQYGDYLGTFSKVVAQKRKIEAIINGDSDAEVDVMDPDDLTKLSMEHKTLQAELENIRQMYTKGTTDG